jgi:hypothetical protein
MLTSRGRLLGGGSVREVHTPNIQESPDEVKYFQAKILSKVKSTLVDHMRFCARPFVIAIFSLY